MTNKYFMKKILLNPWIALITLASVLVLRMCDPSLIEHGRRQYFSLLLAGGSIESVQNTGSSSLDKDTLEQSNNLPIPGQAIFLDPDLGDRFEVLALSIFGIAVIALCRWSWSSIPIIIVLGGLHFIASYLYIKHGIIIDVSLFITGTMLVYIHARTAQFVGEFIRKHGIKRQFEHCLSPEMVTKLQKNANLLKLEGHTRELTVLVCDMHAFRTLAEQYKGDPLLLTKLINRFMTMMVNVVLANHGTICKKTGSSIMAAWNVPLDVPDQQTMAVKSALDMLDRLRDLNKELSTENVLPINIGIGLNTGQAVVCNIGSEKHVEYECLGDPVSTAARFAEQSREYGVKIVIGESTLKGLDQTYIVSELDVIAMKGRTSGARIFTVLGQQVGPLPQSIGNAFNQHAKFLDAYRTQRWDRASILAKSLTLAWDFKMKDYYKMMLIRIENLKQDPPGENWDGIYRSKPKLIPSVT